MNKLLQYLLFSSFFLCACQGKKKTPEKNPVHAPAAYTPVFNEEQILENLYQLFPDSSAGNLRDSVLSEYYRKEPHPLLWSHHPAQNPRVTALLEAFEKSPLQGIPPGELGLDSLKKQLHQLYQPCSPQETARLLAGFEHHMSQSYLLYISGMQFGFIRPGSILNNLENDENPADGSLLKRADGTIRKKILYDIPLHTSNRESLQNALRRAYRDLPSFLDGIRPAHPLYARLQAAYSQLYNLQDTAFTPIPEIGDTLLGLHRQHPIFPLVARRLILTGELSPTSSPDSVYASLTPALLAAVNRFRQENGLTPDSQVGNRTIRLLNRPVSYYKNCLRINMERLRWKPVPEKNGRYVTVNVAACLLRAVDLTADILLEMKVCCGTPHNKTPLLASQVQYLELNPYWHVPQSIVRKEIIPSYRRDTTYFTRRRMKIYDREGNQVDPRSLLDPPSGISPAYHVRQENKGGNSLGRIIFRFPNTFSVYLHDTPSKRAFLRDNRAISHGCVRVEQPLDFAFFLLGKKDDVTADRIRNAAGLPARTPEGKKVVNQAGYKELKYHYLKRTVPIFLDYYTVYLSKEGKLVYCEDIYRYDARLLKALDMINRQQR